MLANKHRSELGGGCNDQLTRSLQSCKDSKYLVTKLCQGKGKTKRISGFIGYENGHLQSDKCEARRHVIGYAADLTASGIPQLTAVHDSQHKQGHSPMIICLSSAKPPATGANASSALVGKHAIKSHRVGSGGFYGQDWYAWGDTSTEVDYRLQWVESQCSMLQVAVAAFAAGAVVVAGIVWLLWIVWLTVRNAL